MDAPKLMKEKQRKGTSLSKQRMMEDEVPGKEKDIWIDWWPEANEFLMSKKFQAEKGDRIQMMLLCSENDNPSYSTAF